nr:NADH-quinone oxidoreductase subunit L [Ignavibacteriaceae bacterium]
IVALLGILLAFVIYQWKYLSADKLQARLKPLHKFSYNKWYFDELYNFAAVGLTLAISRFLAWFDLKIIDGIVNGSAAVTRFFARFSGGFDNIVVDGLVNLTAYLSGVLGIFLRKMQTGKVQTYIVLVIFSLVIIVFLFTNF